MNRFDDFASVRRIRRTERAMLIALGLLLLGGVNYWASRAYKRIDITPQQRYSLSPQTVAYILQIEEPIEIFFIFSKGELGADGLQGFDEIKSLLQSYADVGRTSRTPAIEVEFVDAFQKRQHIQDIIARYAIQEENLILVASGDQRMEIPIVDLYEFEGGTKQRFRGEQVITSAILKVAYPSNRTIYFITGHGEMRLEDVDPLRGLSQVRLLLSEHNLEALPLDLSKDAPIPEDAALLVLVSPQTALLPLEVEKLRNYMSEQSGRLILFLEPGREHGLDDLLNDWGLQVDDVRIVDPSSEARTSEQGVIIRTFFPHPATQYHIDNQLTMLVGPSRPISMKTSIRAQEHLTLAPLMETSMQSWGERAYRLSKQSSFDAAVDIPGPLNIAVAAERQISSQLGITIPRGRMVVVGNADFIANRRIHTLGNRIFFRNLINWGLDRNNLLNLPSRPIEYFHITLSRSDTWRIGILLLIGLPAAIALFGFITISIRYR